MIWKGCPRTLEHRGKPLQGASISPKQKLMDLTMFAKNSVTNVTACCVRGNNERARKQLTMSCTKPCVINLLNAMV